MQKYMQKKRIFPACLFLMFVLMILVIGKETEMTGRGETQKIRNLSKGWYYLKDGERTEVTLPTTLQEDPGTVLELYNDTVTDENRDMVLLTWGVPYHLQIQMDGKTIYQYRDYGFKRNLQMARKLECRVTLPALHKSSQLCFLYTVPESGVCKLTPVYMGSSEAIFRFQIMNAAPVFVIVLGMLVLGIFAIGIYAYLRARKMTERRFASVGLFLLLCGIWCVTDSSLMQYLSHYSPAINEISFYAFMLMSFAKYLHLLVPYSAYQHADDYSSASCGWMYPSECSFIPGIRGSEKQADIFDPHGIRCSGFCRRGNPGVILVFRNYRIQSDFRSGNCRFCICSSVEPWQDYGGKYAFPDGSRGI